MKKNTIALCLSLALGIGLPLLSQTVAYAATPATNHQDATPHNIAPDISKKQLQQLNWLPVVPPAKASVSINQSSNQITQGPIQGGVAAFTIPADRGSLDIELTSVIKDRTVFMPSVLVLDGNMQPAAYYPSSVFHYEKAGIMSPERLATRLKLTPALGQQQIYVLVYTTAQDLTGSTVGVDPAKAYAEGTGNAVPNIPDPMISHRSTGQVSIKVASEQNTSNVMIGQQNAAPVSNSTDNSVSHYVKNSLDSTPVATPTPITSQANASADTKTTAEPVTNETENYFNQAIKTAVKKGDIDKALKLLNEAERLGSTSARNTFIESVKGKG